MLAYELRGDSQGQRHVRHRIGGRLVERIDDGVPHLLLSRRRGRLVSHDDAGDTSLRADGRDSNGQQREEWHSQFHGV